jgi:hypothetical protein
MPEHPSDCKTEFSVTDFGLSSVSEKVRAIMNLLPALALRERDAAILNLFSGNYREKVRDRFSFWRQRKVTEIKGLKIFDLKAYFGGLISTENPRVGGSIPPLGTIYSL